MKKNPNKDSIESATFIFILTIMHETLKYLKNHNFPKIRRNNVSTMQINLGYKCNQSCVHCHVNAGPNRTEMMALPTINAALDYAFKNSIKVIDLTGGAPELHPNFRYLVERAKSNNIHVMDRCNLTILEEDGQHDLADFLAQNMVEIVASMPCYLEDNVDKQRGIGVYKKSIRALQLLNKIGYGSTSTDLQINLVFNPQGAVLPPAQDSLEKEYRNFLKKNHNIIFNKLFTLANMPIKRFGSTLISKGQFGTYMDLLKKSFQKENLDGLMCKTLISVDWKGVIYDCDFNQMLNLPILKNGTPIPIHQLRKSDLNQKAIVVRDHCFGCTAGQGSSCGGALASS